MKKGCKEEINKLEILLERKLTKSEFDLFEFAYDKGFDRGCKEYAIEMVFGEDEF